MNVKTADKIHYFEIIKKKRSIGEKCTLSLECKD